VNFLISERSAERLLNSFLLTLFLLVKSAEMIGELSLAVTGTAKIILADIQEKKKI
jgi:hypothetical protein